eukprot:968918-Rhodomonas_salina.1
MIKGGSNLKPVAAASERGPGPGQPASASEARAGRLSELRAAGCLRRHRPEETQTRRDTNPKRHRPEETQT